MRGLGGRRSVGSHPRHALTLTGKENPRPSLASIMWIRADRLVYQLPVATLSAVQLGPGNTRLLAQSST